MPLMLLPDWRLPSDLGFSPEQDGDEYARGSISVDYHGPLFGEKFTILKASPRVLIGSELLRDARWDNGRRYGKWIGFLSGPHPEKTDQLDCYCPKWDEWPTNLAYWFCYAGTLVNIRGDNRSLTYRIGNYRVRSRSWEATWPD